MAGSSVPLAQRRPQLELPPDAEIEEAVSIHGGGLESYDFHGLEVLQSMVESRQGRETGISRIELLVGDSFERAQKEGRWSQELVDAAMAAERNMNAQRQPRPNLGVLNSAREANKSARPDGPHAISITYKDTLRATVLKVGSDANRWNFACRLKGESRPRAMAIFNSPWGNRGLFKALSHSIQHLFIHGTEPYPVERTLLTTGAVEAAMRSHFQNGQPLDTPHLEIAYETPDWSGFREQGATWNVITTATAQPTGFVPRPLARDR
jgi:hypothetical protein